MAVTSILSVSIFILQALALQVTPNSPCASICLDDPTQDISDPNASNTFGTDIVCSDSDYANSTVGQKFVSCLTCLQGSVASSDDENDQGWFLYNLRYALNSCLFNSSNGTTAISTPCSTTYSCGNLQKAIDNGNLVPGNETEFSYCSADNNAIMGSTISNCISCLQDAGDENYLANFLTALQAGCTQLPSGEAVIGLQGSIFSDTPVNITSVMKAGTTNTINTHKSDISQGAVIGIAVAGVVGIIVLIAFLFVCYRKHQRKIRMKRMASPLDPRFGAPNISAPNRGAYGNPHKRMMAHDKSTEPFFILRKASGGLNGLRAVLAKLHPNSKGTTGMKALPVANSHYAVQLPTYDEAVMRAHLPYNTLAPSVTSTKSIPTSKDSHQSSSTSSESFLNIQASQAQQEKPRQVQQEQHRKGKQEQPRKTLQEQPRKAQQTTRPQAKQEKPRQVQQEQPRKALQEQPRKAQQTTRPQAQQQQPPKLQPPPAFKLQPPPPAKVREAPTATVQQKKPRKAQQLPPPSANAPRPETKREEALYKGTSTPESQAQPIAAKNRSQFAIMRRSTIGRGIGNANASTLPRTADTTALSRPGMLDLERLDLELAEYVREGAGGKSRKAKDPTPISASDGEEQWPGKF